MDIQQAINFHLLERFSRIGAKFAVPVRAIKGASCAGHRILRWPGHGGDARQRLVVRAILGSLDGVLLLPQRVSPHHQEVIAVLDTAMASASRQDQDIARFHGQRLAARAAQCHPRLPACDTQHLMGIGVEMLVLKNAVAPQRRPLVGGEQRLERAGVVIGRCKAQAVEQYGEAAVRRRAVIGEMQRPLRLGGAVEGKHEGLAMKLGNTLENTSQLRGSCRATSYTQ
ncbi:hypothetical protein WR25_15095 [Diploscapter pachys]|uniref:Uncharacterized protein n=1 Tax=Diploscapter pachys TaxID=2018661 RepID=A0A2A2M3X6_9BILA|nr:hypothetical protein WR25_15095 [Diploscapter pachys]